MTKGKIKTRGRQSPSQTLKRGKKGNGSQPVVGMRGTGRMMFGFGFEFVFGLGRCSPLSRWIGFSISRRVLRLLIVLSCWDYPSYVQGEIMDIVVVLRVEMILWKWVFVGS